MNVKDSKQQLTTPLQSLMQRDVSRREFLGILGFGAISVMGLSSIIHFLSGHRVGDIKTLARRPGYGGGPYG